MTPSLPAISTRDSDDDVVLRKVCQELFLFSKGFDNIIFFLVDNGDGARV